jgi:hypothetical protein
VLLVDGLLGHAHGVGDLLPRPLLLPGALDLEGLDALEEPPEGGDRPQADDRVLVVDGGRQLGGFAHAVNLS